MTINYTNRGWILLTRKWQVDSLVDCLVLVLQPKPVEREMMNGWLLMKAVKRWEENVFILFHFDIAVTLRDGSRPKRPRQPAADGGATDPFINSIAGICSLVLFDWFDGHCFMASCSSVDSLTEDGNSLQLRAIDNYSPVETATDVTYDWPPVDGLAFFFIRVLPALHFFWVAFFCTSITRVRRRMCFTRRSDLVPFEWPTEAIKAQSEKCGLQMFSFQRNTRRFVSFQLITYFPFINKSVSSVSFLLNSKIIVIDWRLGAMIFKRNWGVLGRNGWWSFSLCWNRCVRDGDRSHSTEFHWVEKPWVTFNDHCDESEWYLYRMIE